MKIISAQQYYKDEDQTKQDYRDENQIKTRHCKYDRSGNCVVLQPASQADSWKDFALSVLQVIFSLQFQFTTALLPLFNI